MAKFHLGANYPNLGVGALAADSPLANRYEAGKNHFYQSVGNTYGCGIKQGHSLTPASLPPRQLWITPARYKYKTPVHMG